MRDSITAEELEAIVRDCQSPEELRERLKAGSVLARVAGDGPKKFALFGGVKFPLEVVYNPRISDWAVKINPDSLEHGDLVATYTLTGVRRVGISREVTYEATDQPMQMDSALREQIEAYRKRLQYPDPISMGRYKTLCIRAIMTYRIPPAEHRSTLSRLYANEFIQTLSFTVK